MSTVAKIREAQTLGVVIFSSPLPSHIFSSSRPLTSSNHITQLIAAANTFTVKMQTKTIVPSFFLLLVLIAVIGSSDAAEIESDTKRKTQSIALSHNRLRRVRRMAKSSKETKSSKTPKSSKSPSSKAPKSSKTVEMMFASGSPSQNMAVAAFVTLGAMMFFFL